MSNQSISWVCGGGKGIGYAIAKILYDESLNVVVSSKSGQYANSLPKLGGENIFHLEGNLNHPDIFFNQVKEIKKRGFSIERIFCTVHAPMKPLELGDITMGKIYNQIEGSVGAFLNIFSSINQGLLPSVKSIIGFSSKTVYEGGLNFIHRNMAKGALEALIRGSGQVLAAKNISVIGISLGYVDTPQFRNYIEDLDEKEALKIMQNPIASAEDVASFAIYLSQKQGASFSGTIVPYSSK